MKRMFISIDKAGRIVLPKEVRKKLVINPGDLLEISVHGDHLTLHPKPAAAGFVKRGRALIFSAATGELLDSETVEAIRHQINSRSFGDSRTHKNSR
jgi:AbrB family looped-hinge helix DNA binding protein